MPMSNSKPTPNADTMHALEAANTRVSCHTVDGPNDALHDTNLNQIGTNLKLDLKTS